MRIKWYISSLFLTLLLVFGAFQKQDSKQNQEIVLEFVNEEIDHQSIDNTITDIREKLLNIGVKNITIQETEKGTLKISYHSFLNADAIQKTFSKEGNLFLNSPKNNKRDLEVPSLYKINFYELDSSLDISNSDNNLVLEVKHNFENSTTTTPFALVKNSNTFKADHQFKTLLKANKSILLIKNNSSYDKPEVRAGPKRGYFI